MSQSLDVLKPPKPPSTTWRGNFLAEPSRCKDDWTIHENLLEGLQAMKDLTLERAMEVAPKIAAIAQSILESRLKTLVFFEFQVWCEAIGGAAHQPRSLCNFTEQHEAFETQ